MQASLYNNSKCIRILLEYEQTDLDIQDSCGYTALIEASKQNHLKIIRLLIRAGADVNIKSNPKKTALSYAREVLHFSLTTVRITHQLESSIVGCRVQINDPNRVPFWGPTHRPTRGQAQVLCMHRGWAPHRGWKTTHTLKFDNGYKKRVRLYDDGTGGPWRDLTYEEVKGIEVEESVVASSVASSGYSDSYSDEDSSDSESEKEDSDSDTDSDASGSTATTSSTNPSSRRRKQRGPFIGYGAAKAHISPYCKARIQRGNPFSVHVYKGSKLEMLHFAIHAAYVKVGDTLAEPAKQAAEKMKQKTAELKEKAKSKSSRYKKVDKDNGYTDSDADDDDDDDGDDDDKSTGSGSSTSSKGKKKKKEKAKK